MFVLSRLEEHVRILPSDLGRPRGAAISAAIDDAFLDKIVPSLGLCVTLYDILSVTSGVMYPNDGGVWFKVLFRSVIFRPFVGEVMVAKIKKETRWVIGTVVVLMVWSVKDCS